MAIHTPRILVVKKERTAMAYIGQSRSERSQEAINSSLLTKSQLKAWQKRAVEAGAVKPCEWHHTGKYYAQTYYFNPDDFNQLDPKNFPKIPKIEETQNQIWYVLVSAQWGGTKKHPKIMGVDVKVTNKITSPQLNANKYQRYGGYIKEFANEDEAREFAKKAKLNN